MTMDIKPCPKCNNAPKWAYGRSGNNRRSHMRYGLICSNPKCSWSYACTVYNTQEEAIRQWNKKVDFETALIEDSKALKPCSCGGNAELIFEVYGNGYGGWFVRCKKCQKLLTCAESRKEIVEAWNRR